MAKRKYRINLFDILALVAVILVVCIAVVSHNSGPYLGSKNVLVEVKITDVTMIEAALPKLNTTSSVYFSGTKYPIKQHSYRTEDNGSALYVTVEGLGDISDNGSVFNGQRIWAHQKVEIRSEYQLQGYVVGYHYEN